MVGGRERRLSCWHPGLMRHSTSLVNTITSGPLVAGVGDAVHGRCLPRKRRKVITMKTNHDEN